MTREEAISEIQRIIFELGFEDTPSTDKRVDALNMAIKAINLFPFEKYIDGKMECDFEMAEVLQFSQGLVKV